MGRLYMPRYVTQETLRSHLLIGGPCAPMRSLAADANRAFRSWLRHTPSPLALSTQTPPGLCGQPLIIILLVLLFVSLLYIRAKTTFRSPLPCSDLFCASSSPVLMLCGRAARPVHMQLHLAIKLVLPGCGKAADENKLYFYPADIFRTCALTRTVHLLPLSSRLPAIDRRASSQQLLHCSTLYGFASLECSAALKICTSTRKRLCSLPQLKSLRCLALALALPTTTAAPAQ